MKNTTLYKFGAGVAIASVAVLGLAACSSPAPAEDTSASTGSSQMVAPTIVDLATADGQTIDIKTGGFVDLTTGDTDPADWSATVEDPSVVEFTAGGPDGSAVMNPGLQGLKAGSTTVELTNKTTGAVVTLTVNVA